MTRRYTCPVCGREIGTVGLTFARHRGTITGPCPGSGRYIGLRATDTGTSQKRHPR